MADLIGRLRFSTVDGRIWLDDQRMLLIHARLSVRYAGLIESFGLNKGVAYCRASGYVAGITDAQMARKVRLKAAAKGYVRRRTSSTVWRHWFVRSRFGLSSTSEKDTTMGEFFSGLIKSKTKNTRYYSIGDEPMCWIPKSATRPATPASS